MIPKFYMKIDIRKICNIVKVLLFFFWNVKQQHGGHANSIFSMSYDVDVR